MVEVVVVGNGAREHVIAETLVRGGAKVRAFMAKKNPGLISLSKNNYRVTKLNNFESLIGFAKGADFVVVGPEAPLVVGIADALRSANIKCVGPTIEAAQLEGSKIFTRKLLEKYKIKSNVKFKDFSSMDGVDDWIKEIGLENVVVKPDGLTGGKGVKVFGEHLNSIDEVKSYCESIINQNGRFILEEKLDGEEFTLQTFVDGKNVIPTPLVQDHKRAYEGDVGPNTGGMGSYSMEDHLMPFINQEDVENALSDMRKTVEALKKETGEEYKGFLYGQFMKTKDGVKLVEYNVRFGDPEAMNVLAILESNFVEVCQNIVNGNLKNNLKFKNVATVCKYLVPEGYPVNPKEKEPITVNVAKLNELGVKYYFASVDQEGDVIYTSRSRTMGILGIGANLEEAEKLAEEGTKYVNGKLFHRKDIGTKHLLQKRIDHMNKLLSGN
ncbi:MAG: phosphoribosylamine--glycine ligase [Promethearchaeota archaeon]